MADETTSAVASESPSKGQATETSGAPSTNAELPTATTSALGNGQADLVKAEDFRQLQRQYDLQARQREAQLQQAQQTLAATNRRLQELEMRDMPDDQRDAYMMRQQLQQMQAELARRDELTRAAQIELDATAEINDMVEEFGVPFSELKAKWNEGMTPRQLWRYARAQEKERATAATKATARANRENANASVDLGGGSPPPQSNDFDSAMKRRDPTAYVNAYLNKKAQSGNRNPN